MNKTTSFIIVIFCFVKVFGDPILSLEQTVDDDEPCSLCGDEIATVTLMPCTHKLGNECANKLSIYGHINCPFCKKPIQNYKDIFDSETCYRCKDEPLSATIKPCGHKIGNNCANRMLILKQKHCPFCEVFINGLQDVYIPFIPELNKPDVELCVCRSEKATRILKPCKHSVGIECANIIRNEDLNCPVCNEKLENEIISETDMLSQYQYDWTPSTTPDTWVYRSRPPTPHPNSLWLTEYGSETDSIFHDYEEYGRLSSIRDLSDSPLHRLAVINSESPIFLNSQLSDCSNSPIESPAFYRPSRFREISSSIESSESDIEPATPPPTTLYRELSFAPEKNETKKRTGLFQRLINNKMFNRRFRWITRGK